MKKDGDTKEQSNRYLGKYILPNSESIVGELQLSGSKTSLQLFSDKVVPAIEQTSTINGITFKGEYLTLVDCFSVGHGSTNFRNMPSRYYANVFPHYVAVGRCHIEPTKRCVTAIHFTTTDLGTLFYDYAAFSSVIDAKSVIDVVLQEHRQMRPIETGSQPIVCYFTGKEVIAETQTAIGKISVKHWPQHDAGGPWGISIDSRVVITIEPLQPTTVAEALDSMHEVACFLSMAAGCNQDIDDISVTITKMIDEIPQELTIYPSHDSEIGFRAKHHKPHPADLPLDPIHQAAEFATVLVNWISRHRDWRAARTRYVGCIRKANNYGTERIIAAANMFDILPADATPQTTKLPQTILVARDACKKLFQELPQSFDRDSALSALGRLGKPSLPKKVSYRASIVESNFEGVFSDLQFVGSIAVKCRNFFVHGSSGDFDYPKFEALVPFLTDTLEFVFAASDFIDAGWDAQRWNSNAHGWGHSFARFRSSYSQHLALLRLAAAVK